MCRARIERANTPSPRWASVRAAAKWGNDDTTRTWCLAKNSGRSLYFLLATMMVRLQRTMVVRPKAEIPSTNQRKSGFISGAPPVRSTISMSVLASASRQCCMVSRVMISVRSGPASTWQCLHTWLHILPTFTCSTVNCVGRRGSRPVSRSLAAKAGKAAPAVWAGLSTSSW